MVYLSAGATAPMDAWLDALRPGGRLLFPLTPAQAAGGLLLVTRTVTGTGEDRFTARILGHVMFIPCIGARDEETAEKLTEAFNRGDVQRVQSFHRGTPPDDTCWMVRRGGWGPRRILLHQHRHRRHWRLLAATATNSRSYHTQIPPKPMNWKPAQYLGRRRVLLFP